MKINIVAFISLVFFVLNVSAQSFSDSLMFTPSNGGLYPKNYEYGLSNISISGFYRFLACYTSMDSSLTHYPVMDNVYNRVFIGDDSQLPQLSLNIGVSPNKNTSISTDLYLWQQMTGSETDDFVTGLLLGVNLYGTHSTSFGSFGVKTGGIHWHRQSPLTFSANTGYNRFSLFERNPWDPNTTNIYDRYDEFYQNGALTQDERWGQQAFQGFILDASDLPSDFSFSFMHGKSQLNGGTSLIPNNLTGGRVQKSFQNNFISLNAIHNQTYSDSSTTDLLGFNLFTTEFEYKTKNQITLYGEIGAGNYFSPTYSEGWGEAMDIKLHFNSISRYQLPLEVRYFRISPRVINNNGIFWNTSVLEYNQDNSQLQPGQAPILFPFASSLTQIGQMTNNRQGLILNTDVNFTNTKLTIGYSVAKEIEAISNQITYGHPANSLQLSRFWRWGFPSNVGPYEDINKVYRSVFETMEIEDPNGTAAKGFNSLEISCKTKTQINDRKLMIFYLGGFHSIQRDFSLLPTYNNTAYLQSFNHQLDLYYALTNKITLCSYYGYDIIKGGEHTEVNLDSGGHKDQEGKSFALGVDIQLERNTGLYIRHRWMDYIDYNYDLDRYRGTETSVELKIFF